MPKKPTNQSKPSQQSYAQLMLELNTLMGELERADIDVDDAIKLYERGIELTKQLDAFLSERENTLTELKNQAGNG